MVPVPVVPVPVGVRLAPIKGASTRCPPLWIASMVLMKDQEHRSCKPGTFCLAPSVCRKHSAAAVGFHG